jgi:hypothetical protein
MLEKSLRELMLERETEMLMLSRIMNAEKLRAPLLPPWRKRRLRATDELLKRRQDEIFLELVEIDLQKWGGLPMDLDLPLGQQPTERQ